MRLMPAMGIGRCTVLKWKKSHEFSDISAMCWSIVSCRIAPLYIFAVSEQSRWYFISHEGGLLSAWNQMKIIPRCSRTSYARVFVRWISASPRGSCTRAVGVRMQRPVRSNVQWWKGHCNPFPVTQPRPRFAPTWGQKAWSTPAFPSSPRNATKCRPSAATLFTFPPSTSTLLHRWNHPFGYGGGNSFRRICLKCPALLSNVWMLGS